MEGYSLAIREGLRNFRRERTLSLAMTGCVAVVVFAIGAFGLLAANVSYMLKQWESRVELVAFLSRGLPPEESRKVLKSILAIPDVGEARLVSGQQSWEELFNKVDGSLKLDNVPLDEVMPPSIVIRLANRSRGLSAIRQVASRVGAIQGVDEVKFEEVLLERYLRFRRNIAAFTVGASIFWAVVFGIILVNIARLASAARKSETHALRMLGASRKFIRRVFAVEGIAHGLCGSAIGSIALVAISVLLSGRVQGNFQFPVSLFAVAFAVGPVLALLASWFSFRTTLVGSVTFLLAFGLTAGLSRAEDNLDLEVAKRRQELIQLTDQLQQSRAAAEKISERERAVIDELEQIDREMDSLMREIMADEKNIATNKVSTLKARSELERCEAQYMQAREELEKWLRLLCAHREPTIVEVILYDIPQSEMTRRREVVSQLAQKETQALERVESLRQNFVGQQEILRKRGELDTLYADAAKVRAQQFLEMKKQRESLLTSLRQQKSIYLAAISDLEVSARDLQQLIDGQHKGAGGVAPSSVPFREMKGMLPWPTWGEVTVPFGRMKNPDSDTYTRHLGIDISANAGSQIRAIHGGVIAYCDWFRGYGKLVILDHGDNYSSIYSHCSEVFVKKGDVVKAGQPIALVGETGSLKGPFLYFEIRENGQPVDPTVWLQRRSVNATQSE